MTLIISEAYIRWHESPLTKDLPWRECIFMYDNPRVHNLNAVDKSALRRSRNFPEGLVDPDYQLQSPPTYSGDFMQCIEHVHGIICDAWWKQRFRGECGDVHAGWEQHEYDLVGVFERLISPESVGKNVDKLVELLQYVVEQGTGDFAPLRLV